MSLEYNPVLLVVNYAAKIPWYLKYYLHEEIHIKIFFKSTLAKFVLQNPE